MFSGLTNQVNSWMGSGKDEEVPQPTGGAAVAEEQPDPVLANVDVAEEGLINPEASRFDWCPLLYFYSSFFFHRYDFLATYICLVRSRFWLLIEWRFGISFSTHIQVIMCR